MNQKDFFEQYGRSRIQATSWGEPDDSTVEELYKQFKARLTQELAGGLRERREWDGHSEESDDDY
jgi:hypothetical protein